MSSELFLLVGMITICVVGFTTAFLIGKRGRERRMADNGSGGGDSINYDGDSGGDGGGGD